MIANLTAPLLVPLAGRIAAGEIEAPQTLVLSGLLRTERDRVAAAYDVAGLAVEEEIVSGDWAALLLGRENPAQNPARPPGECRRSADRVTQPASRGSAT